MDLARLHELAHRQHGAIGRHQLAALGIPRSRALTLRRKGILVPSIGDSFALIAESRSRLQIASAATLAWGGKGIVTHRTAAWLWGAWDHGDDDPIDITIGGRHHSKQLEGIVFHSPRDQHNLAPIRRQGIRVTIPTRTILDVAAVAPHRIQTVIERMLLAGHVSRDRLAAAVAQHSRRGRTGIGPVRQILRDWPYSNKVAESVLEMRMQTLLHDTPFAHYETQWEIGPFRTDFAWVDERIVLECDGWGKVDSAAYFERAARRDSFLQSNGWIVLHFTWAEITRRPRHVVNEIERAFALRRDQGTGGKISRNS
jgi:very-short-patch-repair endonuclease